MDKTCSQRIFLPDEPATDAYGIELAGTIDLTKQTSIYFQGEIGAGKTTLIRSILRALGVKGKIKSPTFSIMESYESDMPNTEQKFHIFHFDLYRLSDPEELEYLGWRDCFSGPSLCCIEWPENAKHYLPRPNFWVRLASFKSGRVLNIEQKI